MRARGGGRSRPFPVSVFGVGSARAGMRAGGAGVAGGGGALVLDEDRGGAVAHADAGQAGAAHGVEGEEAAGAAVEHDAAAQRAGDGAARDEGVGGVAGLHAVGVPAVDAAALHARAGLVREEHPAHARVAHLLQATCGRQRLPRCLNRRSKVWGGKRGARGDGATGGTRGGGGLTLLRKHVSELPVATMPASWQLWMVQSEHHPLA